MVDRLRRLWGLRSLISTQMYLGIGGAVTLTIAASFVGWISFNRVDSAQSRVTDENVPELAAAFRIAEYSRILAAAAPRMVAATAQEEVAQISGEISEAQRGFEEQILLLREAGGNQSHVKEYVPVAQSVFFTLLFNISSIERNTPEVLELDSRAEALRLELIDLRSRLEQAVIPEIDDQLFYQLTGYRELGQAPAPREVFLTESEFNRYRHLAALLSEATLATQLLSSGLSVSNAAFIEPLQEAFESAAGRMAISLSALGSAGASSDIGPIFARLLEIGTNEGDGFDLLVQKLRLAEHQRALLIQTQTLALDLTARVDDLVTISEESADTASEASSQAISTGRTLLLAISVIGILGALLISWGFVGRILLRRIRILSDRMRRMADGDLEEKVEVAGRDEVAEMAVALEVFRRHALEVQRLNLVEKMAAELVDKNDQLEDVLSELRRAQDQMVVQEKLAALGEVTAGVAHEIRNPLNFVKNFAEASEELLDELKEIMEEEPDEEEIVEVIQDLTDNLERIRNHCARANRIVRDMLSMGRGGGEWQLVDFNMLLNEHALLAFHSARAIDPDFQLHIERDLDPDIGEIEAVPQDLGRVFLNMVGNSCQATDSRRSELSRSPEGSRSYTPTVLLKSRRVDDRAVITIRDNGIGIPPDVMDKIFNPFFTTKPTDKGTGLGLAITIDIIRQHGGTIGVESTEGEFTEMTIDLPLTRSMAAEVESQSASTV